MINRPPRPFSAQVMTLALSLLLPLLALLGAVGYQVTVQQLEETQNEVLREAMGLARAIDEEVGRVMVQVQILAQMMSQDLDLAALHDLVQKSLRPAGYNVVVHDENGWQIMNAALALGSALGRSPVPEHLERVLASERPIVSDIIFGAMRRIPLVSVSQAVRLTDRTFIVNVTVSHERLRQVAKSVVMRPDDWRWGLTDRKGVFIARSQQHATYAGTSLPESLLTGSPGSEGIGWQVSVDGNQLLRAWARTGDGWLAAVAIPREIALAPLWTTIWFFSLLVAGLLVLSLATAQYLTRSLQSAVCKLQLDAQRLGQGDVVCPADFLTKEFQIIHDSMVAASLEQQTAETLRQLLVRELQHRSKNLLSIVLSLTRRLLRGSAELDAARASLSGRLEALAQGTDALSRADWIGGRLQELVTGALEPFGSQYEATGPDVLVNAQWSLNLSLILHELATNAAKYGALSTSTGHVDIDWCIDQNAFKFTWSERGGPPVTPPEHEGFGGQLLRMMTHDATEPPRITYGADGFEYELKIPVDIVLSNQRGRGDSAERIGEPPGSSKGTGAIGAVGQPESGGDGRR